jgi:hypothetical protein
MLKCWKEMRFRVFFNLHRLCLAKEFPESILSTILNSKNDKFKFIDELKFSSGIVRLNCCQCTASAPFRGIYNKTYLEEFRFIQHKILEKERRGMGFGSRIWLPDWNRQLQKHSIMFAFCFGKEQCFIRLFSFLQVRPYQYILAFRRWVRMGKTHSPVKTVGC